MDLEATSTVRVICAFLVLLPTLCGLALDSLVLVALYKGWKTFRSISFYVIITQILGCSFCLLFVFLYLVFPIILTGVQYMGDGFIFYKVPLYVHSAAFLVTLHLTFLLTINRLTIFVFPRVNGILFSAKNTIILSGIVWIYTIFTMILSELIGCRLEFSKDEFYIWLDCAEEKAKGFEFDKLLTFQHQVVAVLMCLMYFVIYIKIRTSQHNVDDGLLKRETAFLVQTIPASALFVVNLAMFRIIPIVGITGYARFFVFAFANLTIIVGVMSSSIMLFIFNKEVREHVRSLFWNNTTPTVLVAPLARF
ncbi:hypothetical protein KIN20_011165 [Parelaphostrongylus tenuis]|uniref:G-protein coupled receptors family 1 profile domain-containing protein n=1 Tax=Parelaphostrongylus tenuis TaxID=148309 RepID=A0AAD5QKW5_PARTN|nr:hypothetical protein KIN20_011165 [Parelaphostrongylus tenuis]